MEKPIFSGPFEIRSVGRPLQVAGASSQAFQFWYGSKMLAERVLPFGTSYAEAFDDVRGDFESEMRQQHLPNKAFLVDSSTGDVVASFATHSMCGMTAGLINDSSKYWLRSACCKFSRPVTLQEWAQVVAAEQAPANAWIAGLLPDAALTTDPSAWRAPTSWELRHVVGEGSFTGMSGGKAALLCGTTPQNFRKYTAHDDAKTRQSIGFTMWHFLLHRLGVQKLV